MEFLSRLWLSQLECKSISDRSLFCFEPILNDDKYLSRLFEKFFCGQRLQVNIFVIFLNLKVIILFIITLHIDLNVLYCYFRGILNSFYWFLFLYYLLIQLKVFNFGGSHEQFPKTYWIDKFQPTFVIRVRRDITWLKFHDSSTRMIVRPVATPVPSFCFSTYTAYLNRTGFLLLDFEV